MVLCLAALASQRPCRDSRTVRACVDLYQLHQAPLIVTTLRLPHMAHPECGFCADTARAQSLKCTAPSSSQTRSVRVLVCAVCGAAEDLGEEAR